MYKRRVEAFTEFESTHVQWSDAKPFAKIFAVVFPMLSIFIGYWGYIARGIISISLPLFVSFLIMAYFVWIPLMIIDDHRANKYVDKVAGKYAIVDGHMVEREESEETSGDSF